MLDAEDRLALLIKKLRQHDFRITPQRVAILRAFITSEGHPSVEEIYQRVKADFPMTSLATVYKTVALLKQEGEILELGFANSGSRYDGKKPYPHPHLICLKCHNILDPEIGMLNALSEELSRKYGYKVISHRLDFYGVCPACQSVENQEGGDSASESHN